jgi:hypothetical protein
MPTIIRGNGMTPRLTNNGAPSKYIQNSCWRAREKVNRKTRTYDAYQNENKSSQYHNTLHFNPFMSFMLNF